MGDPIALATYFAIKGDFQAMSEDVTIRIALWAAYRDTIFPPPPASVARLRTLHAAALGLRRPGDNPARPAHKLPLPQAGRPRADAHDRAEEAREEDSDAGAAEEDGCWDGRVDRVRRDCDTYRRRETDQDQDSAGEEFEEMPSEDDQER